MRHRLIPAALAAGASLALLAGTAMAATPTWTVVPSVNPSATTLNAVSGPLLSPFRCVRSIRLWTGCSRSRGWSEAE